MPCRARTGTFRHHFAVTFLVLHQQQQSTVFQPFFCHDEVSHAESCLLAAACCVDDGISGYACSWTVFEIECV